MKLDSQHMTISFGRMCGVFNNVNSKSTMYSLNFNQVSVTSFVAAVALAVFSHVTCNFSIVSATTTPTVIPNQTHSANTSNIQIRSPPPAKSLFGSQLFQDGILGGVMKTFVNSFPLRESYIAFDQGHPDTSSSPEFDPYFKPSKFPTALGYEQPTPSSYYTKLQNPYAYAKQPPIPPPSHFYQPQHSSYYNPYSPPPHHNPPPPPPPPPFLRLVKIPGDLKITVSAGGIAGGRSDLEVICEFPPYLLIVQVS